MEERVGLPEDASLPHLPFCRAAKTLQFFSSFQSYGNASLPRLWPGVFFISSAAVAEGQRTSHGEARFCKLRALHQSAALHFHSL